MSTPHHPTLDELTSGQLDDEDVRVLQQVSDLYNLLDPVPLGLVDRVKFGITLDALHAEVAELQRSTDLIGVRADEATEVQTVTFTSANLTTMVTITPASGDRVRIDGWIAPGGGVAVELRTDSETLTAIADSDGRFVFDDVPKGPAQFVLRPPAASAQRPVVTPSIEL